MRQVTLGRTQARISVIALGTWSFGGPSINGGVPVGWADQSESDSRRALIRAWELGIHHWDTADVYGRGWAEIVIGKVWDTVPRDSIFLATKVGWDKGSYSHYYHPDLMRQHLEQSLQNLRTDVIDIYYFHHCRFGKSGEYFDSAMDVMLQAQQEGKIRFIGLSDWDMNKIMVYAPRVDPDVIQPYRNVMDDAYESSGLKKWVEDHNVGVAFFSPLKHGLLTGKYTKPAEFPQGDFRSNVDEFADAGVIKKIQKNRDALVARFRDHPEPVLHGLLDSLLADAPTGCVLLGQRNPGQVESAAKVGTAMDPDDVEWVRSLYRG
ncbi:MAG: aldo/keto reductase [Fidelibacterota bacterium]